MADGKTSRGGATGPWDGLSIHYCHTHRHKCPHPSFKCPEPSTGHIKNANLVTVTAADTATVATLIDTIAQLLSELASAQAKLISSLLDNQRLFKEKLSEREGIWNTSGGVADRKTSGGGVAGPWDGPSIH